MSSMLYQPLNPLTPKSAIWHKMPLHAQYLANLCEICTTKTDNRQCTKSCKFSYSSGVYPICMRNRKILHVFRFILDTFQSNMRYPPSLLVCFMAHPKNYLSNGISHGVYQFIIANLEKLGIYLGRERVNIKFKII